MIQTKKQNTDPVAEPETGRPAGKGEEWQGRNRSNKRRLWARLNPRSRKQIRVLQRHWRSSKRTRTCRNHSAPA